MHGLKALFISWYGGHSGGATPEPIPNSEVKPPSDAPSTAVWRERGDAAGHFLLFLNKISKDLNLKVNLKVKRVRGLVTFPSSRGEEVPPTPLWAASPEKGREMQQKRHGSGRDDDDSES